MACPSCSSLTICSGRRRFRLFVTDRLLLRNLHINTHQIVASTPPLLARQQRKSQRSRTIRQVAWTLHGASEASWRRSLPAVRCGGESQARNSTSCLMISGSGRTRKTSGRSTKFDARNAVKKSVGPNDAGSGNRSKRCTQDAVHRALTFVSSGRAGEVSAAMYSLVSSAARHNLDVWAFVDDCLRKLAGGSSDYESLLPDVWRVTHPEAIRVFCDGEKTSRQLTTQQRRTRRRAAKVA